MLRWLFDVDSFAPVNDHRSFSWVTFTLLTRCQAELSILFLPPLEHCRAEPLRTRCCIYLVCNLQPRLDGTEWSSVVGGGVSQCTQSQGLGFCGSVSLPFVLQWWRRSTQGLHQNLFKLGVGGCVCSSAPQTRLNYFPFVWRMGVFNPETATTKKSFH